LSGLLQNNKYLGSLLKDIDVAKVALITLYLGEGSKNSARSSLTFGNSDPKVIDLFLTLVRKCYKIDETKFRCTIQCRADQDIKALENFGAGPLKPPRAGFIQQE